ncbi:hypothetical protein ACLQ24_04060 [Micromonospora sp. DT4]
MTPKLPDDPVIAEVIDRYARLHGLPDSTDLRQPSAPCARTPASNR